MSQRQPSRAAPFALLGVLLILSPSILQAVPASSAEPGGFEAPPPWALLPQELREALRENATGSWTAHPAAVRHAFGLPPGTDPMLLLPLAYDAASQAVALAGPAPEDAGNWTNPHYLPVLRAVLGALASVQRPPLVRQLEDMDDAELLDALNQSAPMWSDRPVWKVFTDGIGPCYPGYPFLGYPYDMLLYCVVLPFVMAAPFILFLVVQAFLNYHVERDYNRNGYGDDWEQRMGALVGQLLNNAANGDLDGDDLENLAEFRWLTIPLPRQQFCPPNGGSCYIVFENATDFDQDNWRDGEEVLYWNDPSNDLLVFTELASAWEVLARAPADPDQSPDFDQDDLSTTHDDDSDADTLKDGNETKLWHTYPQFRDSDCALGAKTCSTPQQLGTHAAAMANQSRPGTGDGLDDAAEIAAWAGISGDAWLRDYDYDAIPTNLLDPDADGDDLLDSVELACGGGPACPLPYRWDSDADGLLDGYDVVVYRDDVRFALFTDPALWPIAYRDQPDGGRRFLGELTRGTLPREWDTDLDTLPDGWEAKHNLSSSADDRGADPDFDGLTNFYEYRCISPLPGKPSIPGCTRPSDWNEDNVGTWWYGTQPDDRDTDDDTASDRNELDAGTNPRSGMSTWPGGAPHDNTGVWYPLGRANPANANVALHRLAAPNLQYLENNAVTRSVDANQTVDVIDQAISAAIAGDVAAALNVLVEATPAGPPLKDANQTVNAVQEAVLGMVRCSAEAVNATTLTVNAQDLTGNVTGCASETLLPFLDALANRTLSAVPDATQVTQSLLATTLPGLVEGVRTLSPPAVQVLTQGLLADPTPAVVETPLDLSGILASPQGASEPLPPSGAAQAVVGSPLIPTTGRHPTFTYDTLHALGLAALWPAVQEADRAGAEKGLHPVATLDSFTFNLYTKRGGVEKISRVMVGERIGVQLDASTATRDASGHDLYVTLTVSAESVPETPEAGGGYRVTPTLRLETAVPGASFELEALGYLQVANAPYVMVLGYVTLGSGQPQTWEGTLRGYDTRATPDRAVSYVSRFQDPRAGIPLHLAGGAFRVDTSLPDKPAVGTHWTRLEAEGAAIPSELSLEVVRQPGAASAGPQDTFTAAVGLSATASVEVSYTDGIPGRAGNLTLDAAGLPAGVSRLSWNGRPAASTAWTWASPGAVTSLEADAVEEGAARTPRGLDLSATSLPGAAAFSADAALHRHSFAAGTLLQPGAPATLRVLAAEGEKSCPGLDGHASTHLLVRTTASAVCAYGRLDQFHAFAAESSATALSVSGAVADAAHGSTRLVLRDGHDAWLHLGSTPATFSLRYDALPNATRQVGWTSTGAAAASLALDATLRKNPASQERVLTTLGAVPARVDATLDLLADAAQVDASAAFSTATFAFSTTGSAPTAAPAAGGDYVRVREVPSADPAAAAYEAAYRLDGVRRAFARVLPDGALTFEAQLASAQALDLRYDRDGYRAAFVSSPTAGRTTLTLRPGDVAGGVSLDYAAGTVANDVTLAAQTPFGLARWTATGVPTSVDLDADPMRQTFGAAMSSQATTFVFEHTTPGGTVAAPASAPGSHVMLRELRDAPPDRSVSARLVQVTSVQASQAGGDVRLSAVANAATPIVLGFTKLNETYTLGLSRTPATVDLTQKAGAFLWRASDGPTTFTYTGKRPDEPRHLSVAATGAPAGVDGAWTTAYTGTFNATVRHDGVSTLAALVVQESNQVPSGGGSTPAGFRFDGAGLAATTHVELQPATGRARVASHAASGAFQAATRVDAAFTRGSPAMPAGPSGWTGDHAILSDASGAAGGSVSISNVREAKIDLFASQSSPAGEPSSVLVDRTAARGLLLHATSAAAGGALAKLEVANAAPRIEVGLQPGFAGGGEGFLATVAASAASGALSGHLAKGGRVLQLDTTTATPATASFRWRGGEPFTLSASQAFTSSLAFAGLDRQVPQAIGGADFVALESVGGSVRFASRLTGVRTMTLEPTAGLLDVATDSVSSNGLLVEHLDADGRVHAQVGDLPGSLHAGWNATGRDVQLVTDALLGDFQLHVRPASDQASRLQFRVEGAPAGTTSFVQDLATGAVQFTSPAAVGTLLVAADRGGPAPLSGLDERGVRVLRAGQADEVQVSLTSVRTLTTTPPAGAAGHNLEILRGPSAAQTPFSVRIEHPDQTLQARADAIGPSTTTIQWPRLPAQGDPDVAARASVAQTGGATTVRVSALNRNADRFEAVADGSPASWNVTFQPTGHLYYGASGGATTVRVASLWAGAAVDLVAAGAPSWLAVGPGAGMRTGVVAASAAATRVTVALAPAGGPQAAGQLPKVSDAGTDWISVDATGGSGLLSLSLAGLQSATWTLPHGSAEVDAAPLAVTLARSAATTSRALVQAVHPDHQTRIVLPNGLPATLDVRLQRSLPSWTATLAVSQRDATLQHQDSHGGQLRIVLQNGPATGTLRLTPKGGGGATAFDWSASGGAARLTAETRWDGGFARADLTGVPATVRLQAGGILLRQGSATTVGTGSIGRADVLLVPDATHTANRLKAAWDHLAVETGGKAPYLAFLANGLTTLSWTLPEAGTAQPVEASIARTSMSPALTVVLSGPGDDVAAKLLVAPETVALRVEPSTNGVPGATLQPFRAVYTPASPSGIAVARLDLTHVHARTGQTGSVRLAGAASQTTLSASGAEPVAVSVQAATAPTSAYVATTDAGTYLLLDVAAPTGLVAGSVTRGTCGATTPFKGSLKATGGSTGAARFYVGDGGKVPPANGRALDARCADGRASVAFNMMSVQDSSWDGTPCGGFVKMDATRVIPTRGHIESVTGTLDTLMATKNQLRGTYHLTFTNGQGLRHSNSDVMATMEMRTTMPTCMRFMSPVDWIVLTGTDVATDLVVNLNDQATPDGVGGVFPTIHSYSPSGQATGSLNVDAHVTKVTQPRVFKGQLRYTSPFGLINAHVFDGNAKRTTPSLHNERIVALFDGGLDYTTRFSDLVRIEGYAHHECGRNDAVRNDYQRAAGSAPKKFSVFLDMGDDCDRQLFQVDALPTTIMYRIDWAAVTSSTIVMVPSEPMASIHWWRKSQYFWDLNLSMPSPAFWFFGLEGIPAGSTVTEVEVAPAGSVRITPSNGRIASFDLGVSLGTATRFVSFGLDNVAGTIQWDLDGDTRFPNNPYYFYGDTAGGFVTGSFRMRWDGFGIGGTQVSVRMDQLQIKFHWEAILGVIPWPNFKRTGTAAFLVATTPEVYLPNGKWYSLPNALFA